MFYSLCHTANFQPTPQTKAIGRVNKRGILELSRNSV